MTEKPSVFISHVHEDSNLAAKVAEQIREAFPNAVKVFVASDGQSIRGGDRWMQTIEDSLRCAQIVLVLVTRNSVSRKWVYFEAGGAFFRGARVIPLLDASISINELGPPLNYLQCCLLNDAIHLKHVYALIAEAAKMAPPNADFHLLTRHLMEAAPPSCRARDIGDRCERNTAIAEDADTTAEAAGMTVLREVFADCVARMRSDTGDESKKAADSAIRILNAAFDVYETPEFLRERWRDKCISDGQLYLFPDMYLTLFGWARQGTQEERAQAEVWLRRCVVSAAEGGGRPE